MKLTDKMGSKAVEEISIVLRKELKEWYNAQDTRSWLSQAFLTVGIFGILMPATAKGDVMAFVAILAAVVLPVALAGTVLSAVFAGERERGTLETPLAPPLSDRALFVGKVLSRVVYAWVGAMMVFAAGIITLWATKHRIRFSTGLFALPVLAAPLVAFPIADIGAIISIRAKSVRSAHQIISYFVLALIIGVSTLFVVPRDWQNATLHALERAPLLVLLCLLVVDYLCLWVSLRTFRRSRLILAACSTVQTKGNAVEFDRRETQRREDAKAAKKY